MIVNRDHERLSEISGMNMFLNLIPEKISDFRVFVSILEEGEMK